jgi:pimeloyl-ACP methyl ester carboxylesterase
LPRHRQGHRRHRRRLKAGVTTPERIGVLPAIQALQTRSGRLSYMLSGSGSPTIVLFSGAGVSLQGWEPLYPGIEKLGTVLGWNRFGMQGSDPPPDRQSGTVVIGSLRELLGYSGLKPPFVLVAHSLGGLFANLFARLYPEQVAGVLFLEATHPDDREVLQKHEHQLVQALGRLLALPQVFFRPNVQRELACVDDTVREIASAGCFPDVPVRVVTGGLTPKAWLLSPGAVGAKRANQQALARLSPLGEQVIAQKSGHFPQMTEPDLVLAVLADLLEQVDDTVGWR